MYYDAEIPENEYTHPDILEKVVLSSWVFLYAKLWFSCFVLYPVIYLRQ